MACPCGQETTLMLCSANTAFNSSATGATAASAFTKIAVFKSAAERVPPGRQALVEVPAGKERSNVWMRQCSHAGELYRREIGRLVYENLIAVKVQDRLQRRPGGGVDIPEDIGSAQQVACCPKNSQQHNIQLKRMKLLRVEYILGIPGAFLSR